VFKNETETGSVNIDPAPRTEIEGVDKEEPFLHEIQEKPEKEEYGNGESEGPHPDEEIEVGERVQHPDAEQTGTDIVFKEKVETAKSQEDSAEMESTAVSESLPPAREEEEAESIVDVIEELENCYKTNDFEKWKSLLTVSYKEKYNDPEQLQGENWDAEDLESFFQLLVQTRRKGRITSLEVSRVVFVNAKKARVFVIFEGKEFPDPQHTFIKINDKWLKGLNYEGG
jgi:hypothetical protein